MALNLNIVIAFPVRGNLPLETHEESINAWKDAVKWAQKHVSFASGSPSATLTLPDAPDAPSASNGDEKGHWEKTWLEKSGKQRVRFENTKAQALRNEDGSPVYPDKEAYCKALCEGTAGDETPKDDAPTITPEPAPPQAEFDEDDI